MGTRKPVGRDWWEESGVRHTKKTVKGYRRGISETVRVAKGERKRTKPRREKVPESMRVILQHSAYHSAGYGEFTPGVFYNEPRKQPTKRRKAERPHWW